MLLLTVALLAQPTSEVCIEVVAKTSSVVESRLAAIEKRLENLPQHKPVDLSPYVLRTELPTWEQWSRIPRCDRVAPMIVRTSTHGHVTAYQDSEGFVRTCYFEPQGPKN
jgi:hypothetical protein